MSAAKWLLQVVAKNAYGPFFSDLNNDENDFLGAIVTMLLIEID